jgi:hypothetical protein
MEKAEDRWHQAAFISKVSLVSVVLLENWKYRYRYMGFSQEKPSRDVAGEVPPDLIETYATVCLYACGRSSVTQAKYCLHV